MKPPDAQGNLYTTQTAFLCSKKLKDRRTARGEKSMSEHSKSKHIKTGNVREDLKVENKMVPWAEVVCPLLRTVSLQEAVRGRCSTVLSSQ